jgi:hypothetical protein
MVLMTRTIVQLNDQQGHEAKEQARALGLSFAAYVRVAIEEKLTRARRGKGDPRWRALDAIDRLEPVEAPLLERPATVVASDSGTVATSDTGLVPRYWLEE